MMSDNFLISLRKELGTTGIPTNDIGGTSFMVVPGDATNYDLRTKKTVQQWGGQLRLAGNKVLVFVHGYRDGSEKALARHNSIKPHVPRDTVLVTFDWPAGNDYPVDKQHAAEISPRLLTDCLDVLYTGRYGPEHISLFVHSMGAYVTETAFQQNSSAKINHLLMAAADVDRSTYVDGSTSLEKILSRCADFTAYWNPDDQALQESQRLQHYDPLGLDGFPDTNTFSKCSGIQCQNYYEKYVQPFDPSIEMSHVWYILYDTTSPVTKNDFYSDMSTTLGGSPPPPTRISRATLRRPG